MFWGQKIKKKNLLNFKKIIKKCSENVPKTLYIYVSKGALSIGEIEFWGKVAGGSDIR